MKFAIPAMLLSAIALLAGCGGGGGGGGGAAVVTPTGFRVVATNPRDGAIGVALDQVIEITLSEPVQTTSVNGDRVVLMGAVTSERVAAAVGFRSGNRVITLTPDADLYVNTRYEVLVASGIRSISAEALGADHRFHFRSIVSEPDPPPPPAPDPTGGFRQVGRMKVGRSNHATALLPGGDVLVTGGFDTANTVTATAETYRDEDEEFSWTAGSMSLARAFHTATMLPDGRVLVAGGVTGTNLTETPAADVYDAVERKFTRLGADMTKSRAFHTATLLGDGRVLIAGGTVPTAQGVFSSRTAEIFDPGTDSFTALPDMAVYRAAHRATLLASGRVLLTGGNSSDARIEIFDPQTDTFSLTGSSLLRARRGHSADLLPGGDVLVMGGGEQSAEIVSGSNLSVRWTYDTPRADRKDHTSVSLPTGHVFFAGGSTTSGGTLLFLRSTEMYDPRTGIFLGWTPIMEVPRVRHACTDLGGGRYLLTGGQNTDPTRPELDEAEVYELD